MPFRPFEVNAPHLAYTFLGGFIVIFGMCSLCKRISSTLLTGIVIKERLYIGEAPIAVVTGIIIGPYVLGFFDPLSWGSSNSAVTDEITLEVTRVIIAISVFAVGVELPKVSIVAWIVLKIIGVHEATLEVAFLSSGTLHDLGLDDSWTLDLGINPGFKLSIRSPGRRRCNTDRSHFGTSRYWRQVCRQARPGAYQTPLVGREWKQ